MHQTVFWGFLGWADKLHTEEALTLHRGKLGQDQGWKTFLLVFQEEAGGVQMWLTPGAVPGVLHVL